MCGIIGYIGHRNVQEVLLKGLELLEYRGYDSAGIALLDMEGNVHITKKAGRVQELVKLCEEQSCRQACCGIGHTRWATHGGVTDTNAHPHSSGHVTLIHNGIIENYQELTTKYELGGKLSSQTDSEVVAALLDHFYEGDPKTAIYRTVHELKGTFALAVMFDDITDKIFAIRNVSPIIAGVGTDGKEAFLASDVTALADYVQQYFVLPEYTLAVLEAHNISFIKENGEYVEPQSLKDGIPDFSLDGIPDDMWTKYDKITIIGCGTAMHAGLVAKSMMQTVLGMQVVVEVASEFIYNHPVVDDKTLVIAISQSGETIDTLEALRYARHRGAGNVSIVNVKGSTIARESEYVFYTNAGPEIAVASTKAYTTQLAALYLIAGRMAYARGVYTQEQTRTFMQDMREVPGYLQRILEDRETIHGLARNIVNAKDVFMIGRGLDYTALLEGSLKLKEISYIHSEAYASGELKHGTIALVTEETPVITLVTQREVISKELSNAIEVKARGAKVTMIARKDAGLENPAQWDNLYYLPSLRDELMVFPAVVVLQLLAFYVSRDKGLDVDKPRNLAKVVTVE